MSGLLACRFVSLPDRKPLDILPPSWELSEALCDLTEKPQPGEPHEKAGNVMDLVTRHCLNAPSMAVVGLPNPIEGDPRPFVGGPWRWPEIVLNIVATWPNDGPWPHWSGFVARCVAIFSEHMQAPLWALDPEKVRASQQEDGIHDADAWLSAAPPEPPAVATPKPHEGDPKPRTLPKRSRGDTDERATSAYMENPSLTFKQLAQIVKCDPSTLRNARRCPKLARARETIAKQRLNYHAADVYRDRDADY